MYTPGPTDPTLSRTIQTVGVRTQDGGTTIFPDPETPHPYGCL